MKIFDKYLVVRFPEQNLLFVTYDRYLYYIYNSANKRWRKYTKAGNDCLTLGNYQDVSQHELMQAMNGVFPSKVSDFSRICPPQQLKDYELLQLLKEDYPEYLSAHEMYSFVALMLSKSITRRKTYIELKKVLSRAHIVREDCSQVLQALYELSLNFLGVDLTKQEIEIIDGHDCSSYFWIMPVRVLDSTDSNSILTNAEMRTSEISIEEYDVDQYFSPFLYRYFDDDLPEKNKNRIDTSWKDESGVIHADYTYPNSYR